MASSISISSEILASAAVEEKGGRRRGFSLGMTLALGLGLANVMGLVGLQLGMGLGMEHGNGGALGRG